MSNVPISDLCNYALILCSGSNHYERFNRCLDFLVARGKILRAFAYNELLSYISRPVIFSSFYLAVKNLSYEDVTCVSTLAKDPPKKDVICVPIVYDPYGFERDIYQPTEIFARETHPFRTEVPLVGGMRRRTNNYQTKKVKPVSVRQNRRVRRRPRQFGPRLPVVPGRYGADQRDKIVTIKYKEEYNTGAIATTVAGMAYYNLNSLFAPGVNGSSTLKPYYYDVLSEEYNHYLVTKVKVRVEFSQNSSAIPIYCTIAPINGTLSYTVTNATTYFALAGTNRSHDHQLSSYNPVTLGFSLKLHDLTSNPLKYMTDDRYQANFGASPVEVLRLYIGYLNSSTGNATFVFTVYLNFTVQVFDPIAQASSTYEFRMIKEILDSDEDLKKMVALKLRLREAAIEEEFVTTRNLIARVNSKTKDENDPGVYSK